MNTQVSHPQWASPRRPGHPSGSSSSNSNSLSRGTSAPTQRTRVETRVETQRRPPLPSSRPPILSRYTAPEDAPKTAATPPALPHRSSGSPGRVYSSPTRPFDRSQSPVMTLRILSPSRHGNHDGKEQDDQENRAAPGSSGTVPPSPGLRRSTNIKQTSPKRRRLPLRDSILLTRKASADFSTGGSSTNPSTPRKPLPAPLRPDRSPPDALEINSMPSTPSTPSKPRLPDSPRLAFRPRHRPPNIPQPPTPPARLPLRETDSGGCQAAINDSADGSVADEKRLISRICSLILDEEFGAGADRSSTPLKVWDTVVRCLDDISQLAQPAAASKKRERLSSGCQAPDPTRSLETSVRGISQTGAGTDADEIRDDPSIKSKANELNNDSPNSGHLPIGIDRGHGGTQTLPCPYRLRNPARFNVNDRWLCATGKWKNVAELQAHIVKDHRQSGSADLFQCPRCEKGFPEPSAFKEHLMLPKDQICDPRPELPSTGGDVEDGIPAIRARDLAEKVERETIKTWDDLWRWLFPSDRMVPRPVTLPAVELPQVEQEVFASSNMSSLKASLEERLRLLALQSATNDSFSAQIPVITGSLSLVVEAHLRSVFIACRNQPLSKPRKCTSRTETPTGRPRNHSSASTSSARSIDRLHNRGPAIAVNETRAMARDVFCTQSHRVRSNSEDSRLSKPSKTPLQLPVPTMLTIPFPRISALTEQSDVGPSPVSEDGNGSPKGQVSDTEYSSGVDSSPSSAGGFRESNNTDIRCSKCNMRPSLRPNEDIFSDPHFGDGSPTGMRTRDSTSRFSDSGIGILCKSCRMLEELINSYSRASSQSGKSERRSDVVAGNNTSADNNKNNKIAAVKGTGTTTTAAAAAVAPVFSPDSSVLVDESEEETLFDMILDSATYLDEEGNRKTEVVPPVYPPSQVVFSEYDRFGRDDNFF
ncbi:hypothetical protein CDEST_04264 [Colletotrichum destructivum]|uniref:C2H2-type domain-containing protein n=1 Tax=Colletotrichum destructivum TaxID=34406 RepID=A0AAX4I7H5_9PEZI|nr:hypothetical protein CDEST_04264 [Colletotrichum destructivum]